MKTSQKIILAVTAVLLSIGVAVAVTVGISRSGQPTEEDIKVSIMDEEAGQYLLVNVPADYEFAIQPNQDAEVEAQDFVVSDIRGKRADTTVEESDEGLSVVAPKGGYEKGRLYTLDLGGKATFTNEAFSKAKKILFCVGKKETRKVVYTDQVQEVDDGDAVVDGDTIEIQGRYAEGDIIVTDTNADQIDEIYKLKDVQTGDGRTRAGLDDWTAEEVYAEIEVYYVSDVDFSEASIDEERFLGEIEKTGMLDAFLDSSYAARKKDVPITVTKELFGEDGYEITATLQDPEDESRTLTITFGISDRITVIYDHREGVFVFDNTLTVTDDMEFSVTGQDKEKTEASIEEAFESYVAENGESSPTEETIAMGSLDIPIVGPIFGTVEVGLTAEMELSAEFHANATAKASVSCGIVVDVQKKKIVDKYGGISGDVNAELMAKGKLDAFAGAYLEAGATIAKVITVGVDAKGGPYLEAEGCFVVKGIPKNVSMDGYYRLELGMKLEGGFDLDVSVGKWSLVDKRYPFAEKKIPLYENANTHRLLSVNLRDTYTNANGYLDVGALEATYMNVVNGKTVRQPIESYHLLLDGEEMQVIDGRAATDLTEGTHTLKVQWKRSGKAYTFKKQVEISDVNPWETFQNVNYLGRMPEEIEAMGGKSLPSTRIAWYALNAQGIFTGHAYASLYVENGRTLSIIGGGVPAYSCVEISGDLVQLFGIEQECSVEELGKMLGVSFSYEGSTDGTSGTANEYAEWFPQLILEGDRHYHEATDIYTSTRLTVAGAEKTCRIMIAAPGGTVYPNSMCTVSVN